MKCEKCQEYHDGSYASGRFCSNLCARSYSTSLNRKEINKKVSKKLYGVKRPHVTRYNKNAVEAFKKKSRSIFEAKLWDDLTYSGKKKRLIEEQNNKCKICNIDSWNGQPIKLRFDHIDGDRCNNKRENCRAICANCDSQLETYCGANKKPKLTNEYLTNIMIENKCDITKVIKLLERSRSIGLYIKLNSIKLDILGA